MDVIPVIDLKHGVVVRARLGERAAYQPIETPLAASSAPDDVVAGLLRLHAFRRLYVADLDAIEGRPRNDAVIGRIAAAFPALEIWVDNGLSTTADALGWLGVHPCRLVLGSESQTDGATLAALQDRQPILSLDFRADRFLGPAAILASSDTWPGDVIVMTLGRVGSSAGPDLDLLGRLRRAARPGTRLWAAGGVRGADDLAALKAAGISGALVSTALHDGRIDAAVLKALSARDLD
ncbi:HisA/HisF-related TIM barrel protein [Methylobrevis pamukkalensis]|uniref:1-(5-phosphoribosyl)-5-[(5-phosphoribosylamino)methylideneamino] imidazole-4-carboxamide isomerase n=1 Tax=Methylobrevis pamukkalensis TaxID=1439726 RepID=A0A1E3H5D9_9HYPH|nr:HisA/HisF-related TIM barrel protein [Methylobrevis pamukkalensis]ODN71365.1 1-(5-phosphoribosyl)-5-[(5-phosphoribosylamino)methylideneamino] imidazole-4-carboxamide isomerase [Methylobrevis pamukkalensis]